jgi:Uma2 family endonuclease
METVFVAGPDQVDIPAWVADFESFREWLHSEEFPEQGKICFIDGRVWVDLSMEEFFSHNQIRAEVGAVLHRLVKSLKFGRFVPEGMRFSHPQTELATVPDGMVVSNDAVPTRRVVLTAGKAGEETEAVGSPEIIIEVVSTSSEIKDTEWCLSAYFEAGVAEYWLLDARDADDIRFDIYKRGKKEYATTRKQAGWVKSAVLGKAFRIRHAEDADGRPEFTLEVR